jgi:hypothetical protein
MIEGVNSTMIHCKNFINVTRYPQHNNRKREAGRRSEVREGKGGK